MHFSLNHVLPSLLPRGMLMVADCELFPTPATQRCYNPLTGLESLLIAPISKASAQQRAGRAGALRCLLSQVLPTRTNLCA